METIELIKDLSRDLKPVRPLYKSHVRFLIWLILTFLFIFLGIVSLGVRSNILEIVVKPFFIFETWIVILLALTAAYCAFSLSIPGKQKGWLFKGSSLIPLIIWICFLCFRAGSLPLTADLGINCVRGITLLSIIPGIVLFIMLKRAAPMDLSWTGTLSVLAVVAFSAAGIQFVCHVDNPLHILLWHILPVVIFVSSGFILGKYFLRW